LLDYQTFCGIRLNAAKNHLHLTIMLLEPNDKVISTSAATRICVATGI